MTSATVDALPEQLRFTGLRHWDPTGRTLTSLVTAE